MNKNFINNLMTELINTDRNLPSQEDVDKVLNTLPDKIRDIVIERLRDNKTFKQMGEERGVSGARISQLYHKGIRMLHHPSRLGKLTYTMITVYEYEQLKLRINLLEETLNAYDSTLYDKDITPVECLGFSIRAYNCLRRAGVRFAYQLELVDLDKVRNLGRKTKVEILNKIRELKGGEL